MGGAFVLGVKRGRFLRGCTRTSSSSPLHKCLRAVSALALGRPPPPLPLNRSLSLTRRQTHLICTHRPGHHLARTHAHAAYAYITTQTDLTPPPSPTQPSSHPLPSHPPPLSDDSPA